MDTTEHRQLRIFPRGFAAGHFPTLCLGPQPYPDGFEYFRLLYNPDDQNVHLAWARQAAQGRFFFRDLFTTRAAARSDPFLPICFAG